ncbi:tetratricopeptide repeat (TPR)-like superfamily protein [Tasmannia lanceolata]|uniref:tetratricopeptide repeat (TPR)-like superfamily protein n=1 Tax=Tasmannia lanceolata TaxID=3420 RepID=UPI004063EEA3
MRTLNRKGIFRTNNLMSSPPSYLSTNLFQLQKYIPKTWKKSLPIQPHNTFPTTLQKTPLENSKTKSPITKKTPEQEEKVESHTDSTWEESLIDSLYSSIKSFTSQGHLSKAFKAFSLLQLKASSSSLVLHPLSTLLLSCTTLKALPQGKQLHTQIIFLGFDQDPLLVSKLVTFYSSFGLLIDAHTIVENSNAKHAVPWNVLISAYIRNGFCEEALGAYKQMVKMGIRPDRFTYPSVLKACGEESDLGLGREVHRCIDISGLEWNLFVHNALVSMYAKCGSVEDARALFEKMPDRDVVSWNAIISGYASKGMWEEAFELFELMRMGDSEVDNVTWNTIAGGNLQTGNYMGALELISHMRIRGGLLDSVTLVIGLAACSRIGSAKLGKEIHGSAIRTHCDMNESIRNALITMYSRCKHLKHAYVLFRMAGARSVVTWNCIISGYTHLDWSEEASFLFREMVFSGAQPNYVTIASILPLCARVANLQHGKELHCYIIKCRFENYLLIWNALVDMYSKSGRILEARRVFESMGQRDEVSYTSLIAGYGMQGEGKAALRLFDEMNRYKIKPDHITMVAVLSACSHSGLVAQGQMLFEKMVRFYGIVPRMEHFSCMVDLFGRAGLLRKAEEIIVRMPFRPSPAMWATLIGACRNHRNIEIGGWAAEKLLEMRPKHPGYYVLIANLYADVAYWSKLAEVRTLMRDMGLKKAPGCAWIDVGNGFHPFLVGDRANPLAQEVYLLLGGLDKNMKEAGYVVNEDLGFEDDVIEG